MTKCPNRMFCLALAVTFSLTVISCGEKQPEKKQGTGTSEMEQVDGQSAKIAEVSFSDETTKKMFRNYQRIRRALVNSNAAEVQTTAAELTESLSEKQEDIRSISRAMVETDELKKQRNLFSELTAIVEPVFREALLAGSIYKQFCPMAFDNTGGYWLSDASEIRNPYFGDLMLKCGEVRETISK